MEWCRIDGVNGIDPWSGVLLRGLVHQSVLFWSITSWETKRDTLRQQNTLLFFVLGIWGGSFIGVERRSRTRSF